MPGPVSDSYDPEWGTSSKREEIDDALEHVYDRLTGLLSGMPPEDIRRLVNEDREQPIPATLTEWEWRILRFAVERARDCI